MKTDDRRYLKQKVTITPKMAEELLAHNENNRKLNVDRVKQFARQMKAGQWQYNNEPIQIYENGVLANGQHRLSACVMADTSFVSDIWYDIPLTIKEFDMGMVRNPRHELVFKYGLSTSEARFTAAVSNIFYRAELSMNIISISEMLDFYNIFNDELPIAADICTYSSAHTSRPSSLVSSSSMGFMYCILCAVVNNVPEETLRRFVKVFKSGLCDGKAESSAIILRNDFLSKEVNPRKNGGTSTALTAPVMKAISDFNNNIPRSKTYKNVTDAIWCLKNEFIRRKK